MRPGSLHRWAGVGETRRKGLYWVGLGHKGAQQLLRQCMCKPDVYRAPGSCTRCAGAAGCAGGRGEGGTAGPELPGSWGCLPGEALM